MEGKPAPAFTLKNQDEEDVSLSDFRGQWVILYFYPKDNTPGCTNEACDFTAALPAFDEKKAVILGVSPDSPKSHRNFMARHDLKLTLLSDPDHEALAPYGAWAKKKNYGREYMGVARSTFIIDPDGNVAAEWKNVKVKGHVEAVEKKLAELQG